MKKSVIASIFLSLLIIAIATFTGTFFQWVDFEDFIMATIVWSVLAILAGLCIYLIIFFRKKENLAVNKEVIEE